MKYQRILITIASLIPVFLYLVMTLPELVVYESFPIFIKYIYDFATEWWLLSAFPVQALYILYCILSQAVPKNKRHLWGWMIFFGTFFSIPIFWYLYVYKRENTPTIGTERLGKVGLILLLICTIYLLLSSLSVLFI